MSHVAVSFNLPEYTANVDALGISDIGGSSLLNWKKCDLSSLYF